MHHYNTRTNPKVSDILNGKRQEQSHFPVPSPTSVQIWNVKAEPSEGLTRKFNEEDLNLNLNANNHNLTHRVRGYIGNYFFIVVNWCINYI